MKPLLAAAGKALPYSAVFAFAGGWTEWLLFGANPWLRGAGFFAFAVAVLTPLIHWRGRPRP